MPIPEIRPHHRGSISVHPYLLDLLAHLRGHGGPEVWYNVEQVGAHLYLLDRCDGYRVLIDTKHRMVEDSVDAMVIPPIPGCIEPEHCYDVTWVENGEPRRASTEASSPQLARLLVRAPPNARVVENP